MSISSIGSTTSSYQLGETNSPQNSIKKLFTQLQQALQSGDLAGAQTAFTSIQNSMQNMGNAQSSSSDSNQTGSNQISSDFQALGTALQSGDVSSAQSAFATLQKDMQAMMQQAGPSDGGQVHRHRHGGKFDSAMAQQMKDFGSIGSALQSGDTSTAQSALDAFLQDIQSSSSSTNPFTSNSQVSSDLQSLQSALKSGDTSSAQSAYAAILQDITPPGMNSNASSGSTAYGNQQSAVGNTVNVTA